MEAACLSKMRGAGWIFHMWYSNGNSLIRYLLCSDTELTVALLITFPLKFTVSTRSSSVCRQVIQLALLVLSSVIAIVHPVVHLHTSSHTIAGTTYCWRCWGCYWNNHLFGMSEEINVGFGSQIQFHQEKHVGLLLITADLKLWIWKHWWSHYTTVLKHCEYTVTALKPKPGWDFIYLHSQWCERQALCAAHFKHRNN